MNNENNISNLLISIVFAAYKTDRYPYILKALDTISRQTYKNFETIIVVDGNDELYFILSNLKDRDNIKLKILKNEKRGGPSAARNMGIFESKGDIIAIIDDDVFVSPRWLEAIVKNFKYDDVLMVGGKILPDYSEDTSILPEEVLWLVGCTYKGHPTERQIVRNVISANMAFRKELFNLISFERLSNGRHWRMSDTLIGVKANECRPGCVVYDPDPVVYHNVPKGRTTVYYCAKRAYTEGFMKSLLKTKTSNHNQDLYKNESEYLAVLLESIKRYILVANFRYALINSVVLVSVGIGFCIGTLKKALNNN